MIPARGPHTSFYLHLMVACGLGKWAATAGNPELQAVGSWARQVYASQGKSRQVGGDKTS
eukprot:12411999-Karenia_brevis.AAC.1